MKEVDDLCEPAQMQFRPPKQGSLVLMAQPSPNSLLAYRGGVGLIEIRVTWDEYSHMADLMEEVLCKD